MQKAKKIFRDNLIIIIILVTAGLFRLWSLSLVPPSPSLDEVSIGYNAHSILKTGRDEYGNSLPLLLRAFDDWRPALYVYLVIPSIALLGLNVFAVRLPSVLLSLATVFLTYKLTFLLFKQAINIHGRTMRVKWVAYASSFLLAISPWSIYLSRLGHEVNLGLFVTVLSIYLFLLGIQQKSKVLFCFSAAIFGLGFSTYQSEKIVLPIVIAALFFLFRKDCLKMGRTFFFALTLFLLFALPAVFVTFSPQGLTRFQGTSVFISSNPAVEEAAVKLLHAKNDGNILAQIYYNRRFVPLRLFFSQYISHFNPEWLFFGSARESHKVPYLGLLYLFEAPFLLLGIVLLVTARIDRIVKVLLIAWFLSSPLPASITTGAPHAMRSFTFLPEIQIIESLGLIYVFYLFKIVRLRILFGLVFTPVVLFGLWQFIYGYFFVFPKTQADSFQSALSSAMSYVIENKQKYKSIVVSNQDNLYQSYMFYLFAAKYDPLKYQNNGGTGSGGYAVAHKIDSIRFRPISWRNEEKTNKILYIGNKNDFDNSAHRIKEFFYPDGRDGVVLVSYD